MFFNINPTEGHGCEIFGYGHTAISDDPNKFKLVSQKEFLESYIPNESKEKIFGHPPPFSEEEIDGEVEKAISKIGFKTRTFYKGTNHELATIAAHKCLKTTGLLPSQLDAIIVGTNTGPGYPTLADRVKNELTMLYPKDTKPFKAMCCDITEACTVGSIAVMNGWSYIKSGLCTNVLVILSEKATELADPKMWIEANLFGDGAAAFLLTRCEKESFLFFDVISFPENGNLTAIYKNEEGFFKQDTKKVQRFVGGTVSSYLSASLKQANLDCETVSHVIAHQPSSKTLNFLEEYIEKKLPGLKGKLHWDIVDTGNTSSVSTPALISKLITKGEIKRGQTVLVTTFGAGVSIGNYAFRY